MTVPWQRNIFVYRKQKSFCIFSCEGLTLYFDEAAVDQYFLFKLKYLKKLFHFICFNVWNNEAQESSRRNLQLPKLNSSDSLMGCQSISPNPGDWNWYVWWNKNDKWNFTQTHKRTQTFPLMILRHSLSQFVELIQHFSPFYWQTTKIYIRTITIDRYYN